MSYHETPLVFKCQNCRLVGIIAVPAAPPAEVGVLIIVGGPQYRAGSHRQFTLLARDLAESGIASLRFDYRGMGDSEGEARTFDDIEADLRAAIDAFMENAAMVRKIVVWGLCDAASAALCYAHSDPRVVGMVLLNPWAHTEAGAGGVRLRHYYLARFLQKSFWSKLLAGQINIVQSAQGIIEATRHLFARRSSAAEAAPGDAGFGGREPYIRRMLLGMRKFTGKSLYILSGKDLVAHEFDGLVRLDKEWQEAHRTGKMETHWLSEASHTFSTRDHRKQVSDLTRKWLEKLS